MEGRSIHAEMNYPRNIFSSQLIFSMLREQQIPFQLLILSNIVRYLIRFEYSQDIFQKKIIIMLKFGGFIYSHKHKKDIR